MSKQSELREQADIMRKLAATLEVASLRAQLLALSEQCEALAARAAGQGDTAGRGNAGQRLWYRLDLLSQKGEVMGREPFKARDDEAAAKLAQLAQSALAETHFELWRGGRLIATGSAAAPAEAKCELEEQAIELEERLQQSRERIAKSKVLLARVVKQRDASASGKRR
jgi:hypothetical protein